MVSFFRRKAWTACRIRHQRSVIPLNQLVWRVLTRFLARGSLVAWIITFRRTILCRRIAWRILFPWRWGRVPYPTIIWRWGGTILCHIRFSWIFFPWRWCGVPCPSRIWGRVWTLTRILKGCLSAVRGLFRVFFNAQNLFDSCFVIS